MPGYGGDADSAHWEKAGIADGMYRISESIDTCNDEIAQMFGVSE